MNEISKRLQQFYEQSGLSYADLALRTGVPKSALQRYISGTTEKIPMDRLEKLAYALDTTPQVLMGWQHDENSDIPPGFLLCRKCVVFLWLGASRAAVPSQPNKTSKIMWKSPSHTTPILLCAAKATA